MNWIPKWMTVMQQKVEDGKVSNWKYGLSGLNSGVPYVIEHILLIM